MTKMQQMQRNRPALIAGALLLLGTAATPAADLISYTFDTDSQGFQANGAGDVTWIPTNGVSGGCLKLSFDGTTVKEADPTVDVSINTAQYLSVDLDLMIDPSSGTTTGGTYGNLQAVLRDSGWSWDSMWYGAVNNTFSGTYKHLTFIIQRKDGSYKSEAHLQFQLQGNDGYTGPVIAYIDNVQIRPVPNPWVINSFVSDGEPSAWAPQSWSVATASSLNTTQDAGGGATPAGSIQLDCGFSAAWGQAVFQKDLSWDPSRFTYLEMDVKVDAANSTPMGNGSYGYLEPIVMNDTYGWVACSPAGINIDASAATQWSHLKLAIPSIPAAKGFVLKLSGNAAGPIRLFVDNIKASNPLALPSMAGLLPGTPGGVQIRVNGPGDQWDRQALCVPASTYVNYTWGSQTPATYSMTLTNFPSPAEAPGFTAHIFIVNESTIPSSPVWNETYGGCDWNAADIAALRVQNGTNGSGIVASFAFKTNTPGANLTTTASVTLSNLASANGTWALNFTDDTHGNIVGPTGVVTNFFLPDDAQMPFVNPEVSFLQIGVFKNDVHNTGKNDYKSAVFTRVLVTNAFSVVFDDDFGAGLTNKYPWRFTSSTQYSWSPRGIAYWLKWTVPDNDFRPQSTASLPAGWTDAGISYIYTDATGTNRLGAIPQVALPAGNQAYFRLINTNAN